VLPSKLRSTSARIGFLFFLSALSNSFLNFSTFSCSIVKSFFNVRNFAYPVFYNIDVKVSEQDKKIKTLKNDLTIEQENVEKFKNELDNADKKNKKPIKEKIVKQLLIIVS
jgi:hypothetical protein